jgi:predicted RND superfamily exporter protein
MCWWGMDLDPVVMSAALMVVGVSVDFTAHTSYHYQHTGRRTDQRAPITDKVESSGTSN